MKFKLLLILLILSQGAFASEDVKFFSVSDMFGISKHEFFSLCKDGDGFIWASSRSEIIRISNDSYKVYHLPYTKKSAIFVKLVSSEAEILAYTNSGQIFRYNGIYDRFDCLQTDLNINLWINKILIADKGYYLIAAKTGLYQYREGELSQLSRSSDIPDMAWYDREQLIIACDGKISILNINSLNTEPVCNLPYSTFPVSKIYYDDFMRRIMVGASTGELYFYDFASSVFTKINIKEQPHQPLLAIESNTDSTLLAGFDGKGIYELNKNNGCVTGKFEKNVNDPYSLSGNGVYDILYDRKSNIVWVCTITGGISFFKQSPSPVIQIRHGINNPNSLQDNQVNQIIEDSGGNLWFATDNGVSCLDVKTQKWRFYHQNEKEQSTVFLSLCEDGEGRIWAGTYSSGIHLIDSKTGKEIAHYSTATHKQANDFVFDIFKDSSGDIWIGGNQNNIIRYSVKRKTFRSYGPKIVSAFAELDSANMVVACADGLLSINKNTGESKMIIPDYMVQDLLIYKDDIWMCTNGEGLLRYNTKNKNIQTISGQSGLNSDFVNSIMLSDGYLWVGTEKGLCRVNPEDNTVVNYSANLSLNNMMFSRNANYRLRDGSLIFGTDNGAVILNPSLVRNTSSEGKIFFQDILVNGLSIRDDETTLNNNTAVNKLTRLSLKYNQNNLAIDMLPMSTETDYFRFSWKLEGHDRDWSQTSGLRTLNYTNIPYGTYDLKIRMYDNSMARVAERSIAVKITPPLWAEWWFITLVTLIVFALVFACIRFYINRLKQKYAEEKVRFFANMAHDIRTSLMLIAAPTGKMNCRNDFSDTDRYYLNLIRQQVHRLSMTVTHLLDFQKTDVGKGQLSPGMTDIAKLIDNSLKMFEMLGKNKGVELEFINLSPDYVSAIDAAMIEKVVDNLISNAIKYSFQNTKVTLTFEGNEKRWSLTVKDCGIGICRKARKKLFKEFYRGENAVNSKITGSGLGLLLAKNYVALHRGSIDCESRENEGSEFKITIPYMQVDVAATDEVLAVGEKTAECTESAGKLKMNILIVEDNDSLRNFMYRILSDEFEIILAGDGMQAWDIIQSQTPDLVVSDIVMPGRDGFELCHTLKSTFETSHIPVILLTSLTDKAQQLRGLGLGADDYLTKPFDISLLAEKIKTIVRNRKAVKERALKLINAKPDDHFFENELNDKFIKKAVEVVRLNIDNPEFNKDDFASAMNVSPSLLYKKIKSFTDQSVVEFVSGIRLNYALELLQSRKYTVMEVGDMCGFSSLKYFSASFKNYFGKKPSDV